MEETIVMPDMNVVLDLQELEVPDDVDFFGNSTGSSPGGCCE